MNYDIVEKACKEQCWRFALMLKYIYIVKQALYAMEYIHFRKTDVIKALWNSVIL